MERSEGQTIGQPTSCARLAKSGYVFLEYPRHTSTPKSPATYSGTSTRRRPEIRAWNVEPFTTHVSGRVGKNRSGTTKSKGREENVVVVSNRHGTLFIGHYEELWHAVNAVSSGNRTIIAAYAVQKVSDFDRAIQGRYTFEQAHDLWRHRVAAVKWIASAQPDKKERAGVRKEHTSAWKASDATRR